MRSDNGGSTLVLSTFFDSRLGGWSIIMCHVGAILGLSSEDLGAIWVHFGAYCAMLRQSWKNLEAICFNILSHSPCEMVMLNLHWFLQCFWHFLDGRKLILWNNGAVLGLSWKDFGATWVYLGGVLCHVGAILGELGSYLVQLGMT